MDEGEPRGKLGELGFDVRPLARIEHVGVNDDVRDPHFGQTGQASFIWKVLELLEQAIVHRSLEPAVALNGLLPVRHRVEHIGRLNPSPHTHGNLGDDQWLGLMRKPSIGGR